MNVDLALLEHHPVDDRADETLPVREGEGGQCGSDAAGEARHTQGPMRQLGGKGKRPRRRVPYDIIDKIDKTRRDSRGCTRSLLPSID